MKEGWHHGDLRKALLSTAVELLEIVGPKKLSLRAVARKIGVSAQAPYHHFGNKEALLAAVATLGFMEVARAQEAEWSKHQDSKVRLVELGALYVRLARARPNMFRLLTEGAVAKPELYPELVRAREKAHSYLERAVREHLQRCGNTSLEPKLGAAAAWSIAHGVARLLLEGALKPRSRGMPSEAKLVRSILGVLVTGLEVGP